ncbi:MAG: cation:proton antiporter [Nitrososphaeraceae archaeon]|jgi:Kef-type K+ transport system membrane component KefB|nr:cation:proton antiporter [Nitrososphaeraceae archaeon]MDW0137435.1 cation:proton antiporter [Nitrososphaeraceae archaeon]MDW0151896.1 cation:proton antiporter [Nitrososphaeraceae archaeon]MDW0154121.1 cation:proton antiporter [Nitrososphaeraceae archaeon]
MATEELFISVVIILVATRLLGEFSQRLRLPPLVGELAAGIIIGPYVLNLVTPNQSLNVISDLGVFFLMLLAGLQMDPREIRKAGLRGGILAVIAFSLPYVGGFGVAALFGLGIVQSMFVGLLLSITAVPVSTIVLMQFGILETKLGNTVITAAVINDIFSLVVLSIVLQLHGANGAEVNIMETTINSVIKILLFIGGIFLVDILFRKANVWLQRRGTYFFDKLHTKEAAFGILLISTILVSVIAQVVIGLHFIIGTFFSGLIVYKEIIRKENFERVYGIISAISFGFFAPIFFAVIGININMDSIVNNLPFFIVLAIVAVITKVGGGYIGSRLTKFSKDECWAIAFLMNGRGMVELVIASIGYSSGIIDSTIFSITVTIGWATTILAPILSRPYVMKIKSQTTNKPSL